MENESLNVLLAVLSVVTAANLMLHVKLIIKSECLNRDVNTSEENET